MAGTRHSDEDILKLPREIELKLSTGENVVSARRGIGIRDATYDIRGSASVEWDALSRRS